MFFAMFVATYGGEDGMAKHFNPQSWLYFYRQHVHSVLGKASTAKGVVADPKAMQRMMTRNIDFLVARRIGSDQNPINEKNSRGVTQLETFTGESRRIASTAAFKRLVFWSKYSIVHGFPEIGRSVACITYVLANVDTYFTLLLRKAADKK